MKLEIEKGIPIPESRWRPTSDIIETLKLMAVGDSFVIPHKVTSAIHTYAKMAGVRITVRKMPDKTRRAWRIA